VRVREERRAVEDVGEERAAHGVPPGPAAACSASDLAALFRMEEEDDERSRGDVGWVLRWRRETGPGWAFAAEPGWALRPITFSRWTNPRPCRRAARASRAGLPGRRVAPPLPRRVPGQEATRGVAMSSLSAARLLQVLLLLLPAELPLCSGYTAPAWLALHLLPERRGRGATAAGR
jgi:hypothetical protein